MSLFPGNDPAGPQIYALPMSEKEVASLLSMFYFYLGASDTGSGTRYLERLELVFDFLDK